MHVRVSEQRGSCVALVNSDLLCFYMQFLDFLLDHAMPEDVSIDGDHSLNLPRHGLADVVYYPVGNGS